MFKYTAIARNSTTGYNSRVLWNIPIVAEAENYEDAMGKMKDAMKGANVDALSFHVNEIEEIPEPPVQRIKLDTLEIMLPVDTTNTGENNKIIGGTGYGDWPPPLLPDPAAFGGNNGRV